jgi:5-(carboxyamino)imidazole ribonucleotide synthase
MSQHTLLPPHSTIGILGGGQLGMMLATDAIRLGYNVKVWCQRPNEPATRYATKVVLGAWDDPATFKEFISGVDVVTYEFENVPYELAVKIKVLVPLRPSPRVLQITQHRWLEYCFLRDNDIPVTPKSLIATEDDIACHPFKSPSILKTCRDGYDGKGQIVVRSSGELMSAWERLGRDPCVLEEFVDFRYEMSVLIARSRVSGTMTYPAIENEHTDGILRTSRYPSSKISQRSAAEGHNIALRVGMALGIEGVSAVEMFVLPNESVLVNEIAPRVHNSGHGTREGGVSQFEQHIRAISGLPLLDTACLSPFVMENLIGTTEEEFHERMREKGMRGQWYFKDKALPTRKMGHLVPDESLQMT